MKLKTIAITSLLIITSTGLLLQVYMYVSKPKYAYININQTFQKFEMKAELEAKFMATKQIRERILDSLATDLQALSASLERSKQVNDQQVALFEAKRDNYIKKRKQMEEDNTSLTASYNKQIIGQMKQYINEYCMEMKYDMVFGEDESGTVLFSVNENDITDEVISYINQKYQGI